MATVSSLTADVIEYLSGKISGSTATSQDIVLQTKALEQLGNAQDLLNAVSFEIPQNDVDWTKAQVFTKTLTADTTFTFSNTEIGMTKDLILTGAFVPTFPAGTKIIAGTYDGTVSNLIQIITVASGDYWMSISKAQV